MVFLEAHGTEEDSVVGKGGCQLGDWFWPEDLYVQSVTSLSICMCCTWGLGGMGEVSRAVCCGVAELNCNHNRHTCDQKYCGVNNPSWLIFAWDGCWEALDSSTHWGVF